jgi:hypothetical protein
MASSVVFCTHEFKNLHITQETVFGVGVGRAFTSVVFRPDYSGEAGRSPWRMLGFSVLSTLNSTKYELCTDIILQNN